ncbi:hypothetical protein D3C87_1786970 [compost metagenome]
MFEPWQIQFQLGAALGADQEHAHPVLRNAEICAVFDMDGHLVAQGVHCGLPGRVQSPLQELLHVLHDRHFRAMELEGRHHCPGG